jgi:hypothetical protein
MYLLRQRMISFLVQTVADTLARRGRDGRRTAQVRKGGLIFEPLGVISGGDQQRGGCIGANPLHGHHFGRSLTNQSIKLLVEPEEISSESRW